MTKSNDKEPPNLANTSIHLFPSLKNVRHTITRDVLQQRPAIMNHPQDLSNEGELYSH